jgi:hypothetical protein
LQPSQMPFPFTSKNHSPVDGRKIPSAAWIAPKKVALTVVWFSTLTVQSPSPWQPPPVQPANLLSELALAESVTFVPFAYDIEHAVPQLIPEGLLTTVPFPDLTTVKVSVSNLNVAVQDLFAVIVTTPSTQSASPLQLANVEPEAGIAVRYTKVPEE